MSVARARSGVLISIVMICAMCLMFANADTRQSLQSPEQFAPNSAPPPHGCILGDFPEVSVNCGESRTITRPIIATPEPGMPACPEESKVVNGECDCKYHCPKDEPACNQTLTLNWEIDQLPTSGGKPCQEGVCAIKTGPPCSTPTQTPTPTPTPLCGNRVVDPGEECDFAVPPACPQCSCNKDCELDCPDTCVNNHECSITDDGKVRLDVWWGPDVPAVGPGPLDLANVEPWPFMPSGTASLGCCPERFWGTHKVTCQKGQTEVVFLGKAICPSAIGAFTGARITCPCPPPIDCVLGDWPATNDLACGETRVIKRPILVAAQNGGKDCPVETKQVTRECTPTPTYTPTSKPTDAPTPQPTPTPTEKPTPVPTAKPTDKPTEKPTDRPTERPTATPTRIPTRQPTVVTIIIPATPVPTERPTDRPTDKPTDKPTDVPTSQPTVQPSPSPGSSNDEFCKLTTRCALHNTGCADPNAPECPICNDDSTSEDLCSTTPGARKSAGGPQIPAAVYENDSWSCKCVCQYGPADYTFGCGGVPKPDPCENFVPSAGGCNIDPPPWDCMKNSSCGPEIVSWTDPQPTDGEYPRKYCCRQLLG